MIQSLTAIRAIACLMVLYFHLGHLGFVPVLRIGQLGVMVFFSLAGFLMCYHYSDIRSMRDFLGFYICRFFRVYPAYFVVILSYYLIHQYGNLRPDFGTGEFKMTSNEFIKHLFLLGNMNILWTIPVEMSFYALFPVIALTMNILSKTKRNLDLIFCFAAWFFISSIKDPGAPYFTINPIRYLEFFLIGVFFACLYKNYPNIQRGIAIRRFATFVFFLCTLTIALSVPNISESLFNNNIFNMGYGVEAWKRGFFLSIITGSLIFSAFLANNNLAILHNHFLQFIGKISYSLYLIHYIIFALIAEIFDHNINHVMRLAMAILSTFICAILLHLLIEKPFISLGKKIARRYS